MPFIYDPKLKGSGYRDTATGRIVAHTQVREYVNEMISTSGDVQSTLAQLVSSGAISPADWRTAMRQEIKDNYVTQYLAGIGGRDVMKPADWGSIGGLVGDQYRYLENFYAQVAAGELSEAQIYARSRMYINSSRDAYERALGRASIAQGYTEHRWVMAPAEHCDDCIALASLGWIPITESFVSPSSGAATTPGAGDTLCLTNCKCHIEYRE